MKMENIFYARNFGKKNYKCLTCGIYYIYQIRIKNYKSLILR